MANPKGDFIWYELMTDNPDGARPFYAAVIGWHIDDSGQVMPTGAEYRMIRRSDGGNAGGLMTISGDMKVQGAKPGWIGYIHHPDVDAAVERFVAAGGTVHLPPTDMGVGRMAMISDPWGATFYVMNPTPPADQPDAMSDVFRDEAEHFRWNDLWTADQDAAAALYGEVFGWTVQGGMPMGDGREYRFLYNGDGMIGGLGQALPEGRGPRWECYIGVDDIDRAAKAVEDKGGELAGQINPIPGGHFAVHIRDPQGAAVGIVGPRTDQTV